MTLHSLVECQALDQQDPLRSLRELFQLPEGVIYLDGNSLGVLPKAAPARIAQAVAQEWGTDLIKSWNTAGWFQLPLKVGNKIARLIGARENEVVAADSTSINLFKVLSAALSISKADHPQKNIVLSER
ncbi:MAG: kynureninase, partial [Limnohabitans sp.]